MSRSTRHRKLLRSGAIGFLAGLATLGVVANGAPATALVTRALGGGTTAAAPVRSDADARARERRTQPDGQGIAPTDPSAAPAPAQVPQSRAS